MTQGRGTQSIATWNEPWTGGPALPWSRSLHEQCGQDRHPAQYEGTGLLAGRQGGSKEQNQRASGLSTGTPKAGGIHRGHGRQGKPPEGQPQR